MSGYFYPYFYSTVSAEDIDFVLETKRLAAHRRQALLGLQKDFAAAKNYEAAKAIKEPANALMRVQRVCCLFLGWMMCTPPGDSPLRPFNQWGVELEPECRRLNSLLLYPELRHVPLWEDLGYVI